MDNTKTAIEELLVWMEEVDVPIGIIKKTKLSLETEKQQIIHAYEEGQRAEAKQEFWTKGNKYYEETYNKK